MTAFGSMAVTRRIGTKILLRVSSSTTSPSTRGCWRTMLMLITTSRTRPRDSPSGPSTTIPARRAAYTLFTDAMTTKGRSLRVNDVRYRPRRTCLSVPGSNPRMIEKAKGLPADEVFLDLEDAVAADAKDAARTRVAAALGEPGWGGQVRGVRVNDWTTPWTYTDVIEVVSAAGAHLDVIVLPKVADADHVQALDLLLTQVERTTGCRWAGSASTPRSRTPRD